MDNEIRSQFQNELADAARALIACFDLKYTQKVDHLCDPIMRWLDFRLRYIDPAPRNVISSNSFPSGLDESVVTALNILVEKMRAGDNINPYQGKGIMQHHDTSGDRNSLRTDLLWADWGIHHFHLTSEPVANRLFSARSDWLLFAIVSGNEIGMIDIRRHNEDNLFSDPRFMEIIAESWPGFLDQFRLKGVLAGPQMLPKEDVAVLRKKGVSPTLSVGNNVYIGPGMGITSASTPLKVTFLRDRACQYARDLASIVIRKDSQFMSEMRKRGVKAPSFTLCLTPLGLSVYEKTADMAFVLPRGSSGKEESWLGQFHDLFAPQWAIDAMTGKGGAE